MSNGIQIEIADRGGENWEFQSEPMIDVIRVTLTIVMRYITRKNGRDINDDLIMNVQQRHDLYDFKLAVGKEARQS